MSLLIEHAHRMIAEISNGGTNMILIAGAGIAGLTLANYLEQAEIPYQLLEQAEKLQVIGAGIMLQNNGLAILEDLGLAGEIRGAVPHSIGIAYRGKMAAAIPDKSGLNAMLVHRAELQRVLLQGIPAKKMRLNKGITSVQRNADETVLQLNDGGFVHGDVLVDAAGLYSNLHGEALLRDSGQWCWRAIVDLSLPISHFGEFWFDEQRVGIGAINDHQAYVFHVLDQQSGRKAYGYRQNEREAWIRSKAKQHPDIAALKFEQVQWLSHSLQERTIHWGCGNTIAIGDAAHGMTPNLGQGAVLAMEDAVVLAQLIKAKTTDLSAALASRRDGRVRKMQKRSWATGKLAHNSSIISRVIKSAMFRVLPMNKAMRLQVDWMNEFISELGE